VSDKVKRKRERVFACLELPERLADRIQTERRLSSHDVTFSISLSMSELRPEVLNPPKISRNILSNQNPSIRDFRFIKSESFGSDKSPFETRGRMSQT
jgi:hypothetical protein